MNQYQASGQPIITRKMTPEALAQTHSQIIDGKLSDLNELFKSVNIATEKQISELFNGLELDAKGMVKKNAKNRRILNQAIAIIRKKTKALRPVVFNQYLQATEQINNLSEDYINWISK